LPWKTAAIDFNIGGLTLASLPKTSCQAPRIANPLAMVLSRI
jgi:hypothetical protein